MIEQGDMMRQQIKWTYGHYQHVPDDKRCELMEGKLLMVPSLVTAHQRISRKLELALCEFIQRNNLGEVFDAPFDVVLSQEHRTGILFDEPQDTPVLGVTALESLGYELDSVTKKLKQVELLML